MQPVTNRCSGFNDPDPPDVFCSLGSLIVEGRVPSNDDRGYGEGPHVPLPRTLPIGRHECSEENYMCKRDENFRKHLLLLWQNNVPISIEVLLCSDCRSGEKRTPSVEFTSIPEPGAILLEQWTVSIHTQSPPEQPINSRGLFQAVRSYLHFSQLSAWYSSTKGQEPKNILYRITIPGENFSSKFSQTPVEHHFPPAYVGQSSCVFVTVRSLARREEIPTVVCCHNNNNISPTTLAAESPTTSEPECLLTSLTPDGEEIKLPMAGALAWKETDHPETDLRKAIVKTRLAECSGLDRSDSMDSILGDSLLDPPQSLQKIPPKRYQSPSRCGSPSLEAPDHLLFGHSITSRRKEEGGDFALVGSARRARQDLLRRRDLNLFYGLHPRVLDHKTQFAQQQKGGEAQRSTGPFRAYHVVDQNNGTESQPAAEAEKSEDDCAFVQCTQAESGKRSCKFGDGSKWDRNFIGSLLQESELCHRFDNLQHLQDHSNITLGTKSKQSKSRDSKFRNKNQQEMEGEDDGEEVVEYPTPIADLGACEASALFNRELPDIFSPLSPKESNCSSRRSSLKESDDSLLKKKGKHLEDIFDDGSFPSQQRFRLTNPITQVYRAETANSGLPPPLEKSDILLGAILRTSERNRHLEDEDQTDYSRLDERDLIERERYETFKRDEQNIWNRVTTPKSSAHAAAISEVPRLLQEKLRVETETEEARFEKSRLRSRSENISADASCYFLDPLDLSFDDEKLTDDKIWGQKISYEQLDNDNISNYRCDFRANGNHQIPSTDAVNTFLKSFDSATSMVFHGRTGLPLTSSPAPLRRGKGKFDYDSCISSPHDIKRALFPSQLPDSNFNINKKDSDKDDRRRRPSQKLLSASAPATMASTNLLCNFEESVLNGRLEPVSTVEGFTAEIGASGSFHPKHTVLPVTVFFYTLCDNATVSSPYLGHINLGKKGYRVPQKGTIQVTLFNPLGTVVKMFVVMYDLSDMPPNSQTFLRQRTLYMPSDLSEANNIDAQKWLRYLVHLRFASSKSGKVYLHTDIRMIIFRKSDLDTATDHNPGKGYELRSFTRGPTNPKFSPRR